MSYGELSVLNVGAGDIQVTFNEHDKAERQRAIKMLKDMQSRGYAILVELDDGTYTRAVEIDATRGRYVLQLPEADAHLAGDEAEVVKRKRGRPPGRSRVSTPIKSRKAVGVARSAGG